MYRLSKITIIQQNCFTDLEYTDLSLCVTLLIDFRNKSASQQRNAQTADNIYQCVWKAP